MPSENKTPNLGLNQWQGNEYVKRQDFVEDNYKIDQGFENLKKKIGSLENLATEEKSDLVGAINEIENTVKTHLAEMVNQIQKIKRGHITKKPMFCVVDDDCRSEAYTILKPMLETRGLKGTFACITGQIGSTGRLTEQQMLEMHEAGHEFISHGHTHTRLSTLSEQELHDEFMATKNTLKELGMPTQYLAYPNGDFNKTVVNVAEQYFDAAMVTDTWANRPPLKTYALGRIGVGAWGSNSWEVIKNRIDTTIKYNGLGILMTHVGDNTAAQNQLIEQALDYIIGLGYEIVTFGEAYEHHKNLLEYGEYNETTRQVDYVIAYDGTPGGNDGGIFTQPPNTYLNDTPITDFKPNSVTVSIVSTANANGFPFNAGGTLTTYRFGSTNEYAFQLYKITWSDILHYRRWNANTSSWEKWHALNVASVQDIDKINSQTPPSEFSRGVISYCPINYSNREGFPTNSQGLVITNTVGLVDGSYNIYQEFHTPASNLVYRRTALNSSTWSEWYLVNAVTTLPTDSVTPDTPKDSFPNRQISYCRISTANAQGFPENVGGLLMTNRLAGSDYYIYQEYEISASHRKYRRHFSVATGQWSEWRRYTFDAL